MGELMSMTAELRARYGSEPDMAYNTHTGVRILSITFGDYQLPETVTAEIHARQIAAFAIGTTTKLQAIDEVEVLFETSAETGVAGATSNSGPYSFGLEELMPAQPQAEPAEPALLTPRSN